MENKKVLTSESVGRGHPDKICDQISDLVLDECLKQDKNSRVACECFACNRLVIIGGEITTQAHVDAVKCGWTVLKSLGYNDNDFTVISNINKQSSDISKLVDKGHEGLSKTVGAGDQGITIGYATNETKNYMPLEIDIANEMVKLTTKLIEQGKFPKAKYDMKSQVSIEYDEKGPKIDTMLMSIQHEKFTSEAQRKEFKNFVIKNVFLKIAKQYKLNTKFKTYVNQAGDFVIGGPIGDTGLTGRKLMVDNYGPAAHHGGGAYSGKDYTKVDRTGAYYARWIAKNIVAANFADKCEVQLGWCIGIAEPVSVNINTFGTEKIPLDKIYKAVTKTFSITLYDIIKSLNLQEPIYSKTSYFGHFGKDEKNLPWEQINKVQELIKNK